MRRTFTFLAVTVVVTASAALASDVFPKTIALPNGWLPEGIAIKDNTFYAGSRANGAIYSGDLRTGEGSVLVAGQAGRSATGLKYDRGRLFVSGAATGRAWVYDAETGDQLREYVLTTEASTFINDVVVTRTAAYFTDSLRPVIYKVPLSANGAPGAAVFEIPVGGEFEFVPGAFNLNGIDATPNGRTLVAVNSTTGLLYTIDPESGDARRIDLGGATLTAGDGILLIGRTLYVVRNRLNQIAVVQLAPDLSSGDLIDSITDPNFDIPTTVARSGNRLYLPNARFTTPPTPSTTYNIVQVRR